MTPARMLLFSSFRPLIKYAKLTQLWSVWLSKLSNQNYAAFFAAKCKGDKRFSYFLFSLFAGENEIIRRTLEDGKSKKRPAKKENNCNVCRVCQVNLKVTYGHCVAKSCVNIFKPLARKETFGVVLRETLKNVGITVNASDDSQVACNACYRKIKNLGELLQFIRTLLAQKREENKENSEGAKRKLLDVLSPTTPGSPHNRKSVRTNSPDTKSDQRVMKASSVKRKKSLQFADCGKNDEFLRAVHSINNVLSKYNIDDLDTSKGAAVKVVIAYPSGDVSVVNKIDEEGQSIKKHCLEKLCDRGQHMSSSRAPCPRVERCV